MMILADVGLPMIFLQWPFMICALIPVIIVEALLIRRWVPLSNKQSFAGISLANIVSTLIGIPLAWLAMLLVEFIVLYPVSLASAKWHWNLDSPVFSVLGFVFSIAWLEPTDIEWIALTAGALLLIPCFYASVWIERAVCLWAWPDVDRSEVRRGVFLANMASYALLFLFLCGWIIWELVTKKGN